MNKLRLALSVSFLTLVSACDKTESSNIVIDPVCYQGKFLNGISCSNVAAVQILSPKIDSIDLNYKAADLQQYEAAIALTIPDDFKDGEIFYFTLDSIYVTPAHLANCFYVPKYSSHVKVVSRTSCSATPE